MGQLSFFQWLIIIGVFYLIFRSFKSVFGGSGKVSATGSMICPDCGSRGEPKQIARGSTVIELFLWLCFIVPGIFYSLWRLSGKQPGCPSCGQTGMIKVSSPRGQQLISAAAHGEQEREKQPNQHTRVRCPACAELVLKAANVCKHCGLDLTAQKPAAATPGAQRKCPYCSGLSPAGALVCKVCYREF